MYKYRIWFFYEGMANDHIEADYETSVPIHIGESFHSQDPKNDIPPIPPGPFGPRTYRCWKVNNIVHDLAKQHEPPIVLIYPVSNS